ncbi:MAG: RNA-guided pseudouridylation complex pseudouridine synthase subunit Cbf5 [Candidatus Hodarchaeales archaeon]
MSETSPQNFLPSDKPYEEYIKREGISTNPEWGTPPEKRSLLDLINSGIINLDKPANPTSHEVAAWVRRILRIDKTGHGGTLDPQVTGCLPIALGRSTKAVQVLLPAGKEYIGIGKLHGDTSEQHVRKVAKEFIGKIYQMPPVRSSVKRRLRVRTIYYLEILEVSERQYLFRVGCQAGTYIRKLCVDIGMALGLGGHMKELRRTRSGPFRETNTVKLHDLVDAAHYYFNEDNPEPLKKFIQPIEVSMTHLPYIKIRDNAVDAICHGASLTAPGIVKFSSRITQGALVVIKSLKDEAIALGRAVIRGSQIEQLSHGIVIKTERVIMEPGTYPPLWKK